MLRWISSWMFALAFCGAASAQISQPRITPAPSLNEAAVMQFVHDVRVGNDTGRLLMSYNPRRSGPVSATLLGVAVDGFYYTAPASAGPQPAHSLVLLRRENGAVVQVITADYDYTARNWLGMAHWLSSGANQGSAAQNAVGFRTVSPAPRFCRRGQNCVPDSTLPTISVASSPLATAPLAGVNASVGAEAGPLIFRRGSDGLLSGHLWGESISGHYAAPAGTVVFLRMRNGQPFQVWRGVLDASGAGSGGRGFPLDATGGEPFTWAARAQDQIVTGVRSIYSRRTCAAVDTPADGAGAFVNMFNCTDALHEAWVLFALTPDRFALAYAESGLCLHLSQTRGERVVQQPCRGGASQELQLNRRILDAQGNVIDTELAHNTADVVGASYFTIFGSALAGGLTECMGVQPSQGNIITLTCQEDKGFWTAQ